MQPVKQGWAKGLESWVLRPLPTQSRPSRANWPESAQPLLPCSAWLLWPLSWPSLGERGTRLGRVPKWALQTRTGTALEAGSQEEPNG